jgi:hypothetical protein
MPVSAEFPVLFPVAGNSRVNAGSIVPASAIIDRPSSLARLEPARFYLHLFIQAAFILAGSFSRHHERT